MKRETYLQPLDNPTIAVIPLGSSTGTALRTCVFDIPFLQQSMMVQQASSQHFFSTCRFLLQQLFRKPFATNSSPKT
jgi:hypothetical protein